MKKVLIVFNYMQPADGVCRTAISFANALAELNEYEITFVPMFKLDKKMIPLLNPSIKVRKVLKIPYIRGIDRLTSKLPPKWIYKSIVKKEKFDIEFGYCWRNPTIAIANSLNKDAKHIIYTHGYNNASKYYPLADLVIAISTKNAKRISEEVNGRVPVIQFTNMYNEEKILKNAEETPSFTKNYDKFLFVTCSRLSEEKGYLRMLESAKKIKDEGYDFNIWMIGDGPERNNIEEYIKNNNLKETVTLVGNQMNPFPYMKQGDCMICSSFSEGYSTVCVESCILGVPVLSTDISGADDIINKAKAGKIVSNDEKGTYEGMKYFLDHPEKVNEWKETLKTTRTSFYKENGMKELKKLMRTIENIEHKE